TTLWLGSVKASDAGNYSVEVTNSYGAVSSSVATLSIVVPPAISTHPQPQIVAAGATATFSVTVSGTAPFQYQWQKNGLDLPGMNNATLVISGAETSDEGDYSVVVSNSAGDV